VLVLAFADAPAPLKGVLFLKATSDIWLWEHRRLVVKKRQMRPKERPCICFAAVDVFFRAFFSACLGVAKVMKSQKNEIPCQI
jgi:hypothetical protein